MLLGTRLYRNLLREAGRLPDAHASAHYRQRVRDVFGEDTRSGTSEKTLRQLKRAQQLLRHLQAANDGYLHAIKRVLETAYGIRGPKKHEALMPYLLPNESTKTFSRPLSALVTSSISHTSRPPSLAQLSNPPTMPERADPLSEEARLMGPLKPQRIRAIKRRWWNLQTSKIKAPIAMKMVHNGQIVEDHTRIDEIMERLKKKNVTGVGKEGTFGMEFVEFRKGSKTLGMLEQNSVVPIESRPRPPRRLQSKEERSKQDKRSTTTTPRRRLLEDQDRRLMSPSADNTKWHRPKQVTSRLMRRRAQELLDDAPIVVMKVNDQGGSPTFEVQRSRVAKMENGRLARANDELEWWLAQDVSSSREKEKGSIAK